MPGLVRREPSAEGMCCECKRRPSVGPCAACHGMVCGDCCTITTDPGGTRAICLSCARMVSDLSRKAPERRPRSAKVTAYLLLAVFGLGLLAVLAGKLL